MTRVFIPMIAVALTGILSCQKAGITNNGSKTASTLSSNLSIDSTQEVVSDTEVLSEIDYKDGIYDITTGNDSDHIVYPVYNLDPSNPLPCSSPANIINANANGILNRNNQCIFDETDLDKDGRRDIDGVNKRKLVINLQNGSIDLVASYYGGVFGSVAPINGEMRDYVMYYRLSDRSRNALKKIAIRLIHYKTREDIPLELANEIQARQQYYSGNTVAYSSLSLSYIKPKRPPLIIIVSGR